MIICGTVPRLRLTCLHLSVVICDNLVLFLGLKVLRLLLCLYHFAMTGRSCGFRSTKTVSIKGHSDLTIFMTTKAIHLVSFDSFHAL